MTGRQPILRFVVLHHTGAGEAHYDLLIETDPQALLKTWRCAAWPVRSGDSLTELSDHRRIYLDYEGPISGNRGEVRRVDAGEATLQHTDLNAISLLLKSASGSATLKLNRSADLTWTVS